MMHAEIQEQLLRYLDGDLPDEEMQKIREHLSTCSACSKQYEVLASLWRSDSRLVKVKPSPFLWTRLQARIREYEQTPTLVWGLKTTLKRIPVHPFPAFAVIAAIVVGIYLGSPRESQRYDAVQLANRSVAATDELGLDQFDVVPPGALGSTLIDMSNAKK
jgi:anti-sigma factor RsiW